MQKSTVLVITLFLTVVFSVANAKTRNLTPQPPPGVRALNPQPLPPGMKVQSKVQVNPQPLPPSGARMNRNLAPGSTVGLNPQPYPPHALNPQPLPLGAK